MTRWRIFAPAKVNLALHVTGQRADGYHLLDSAVAFADVGDWITLEPADATRLTVTGPLADGVPTGPENLLWKALDFAAAPPLAMTLEKHLPAAAGIGGGSADAAALFRGLAAMGVPVPQGTEALGADIPMCLSSAPLRASGIGEALEPLPLSSFPAVLVNPGVPVPTGPVFSGLHRKDNAPLPPFSPPALFWLSAGRNDLEPPAKTIAPEVAAALAALEQTGAALARMSGSGATCFGLFSTSEAARAAAKAVAGAHPGWWVAATELGDQSAQSRPQPA